MVGPLKRLQRALTGARQPPLVTVVSGLPRSGTSLMMRMLEAGGLPPLTDEVRTANVDNPKGYYEFERVKALDKGDTAWLPEARGKAVKVISALLKHLPDDHTYRVLFMRRHLDEVLASQKKMLERRGKPADEASDDELRELFERHIAHVRGWAAGQANVQLLEVSYNDLLADPQPVAERVAAFVGGELDVEAMVAEIDPSLYRNRA